MGATATTSISTPISISQPLISLLSPKETLDPQIITASLRFPATTAAMAADLADLSVPPYAPQMIPMSPNIWNFSTWPQFFHVNLYGKEVGGGSKYALPSLIDHSGSKKSRLCSSVYPVLGFIDLEVTS